MQLNTRFSWNSRGKLTQLTAVENQTTTTFSFSYDGMNRINEYIKTVGGIQSETWKFYYGPTGIEKVTRREVQYKFKSKTFITEN